MTSPFVTRPCHDMGAEEAYRLLTGAVVPRPIAWITTLGDTGVVNAAPFSSYNYVAHDPPAVAVNIARRAGELKDTARNIAASGEFVVNVATHSLLDELHASSAAYGPDESECDVLGLDLVPGTFVRVPRIARSPIHLECRLIQEVPLGSVNTLYIARVLAFHLSPEVFDGRRIDVDRLAPLARLGGPFYAGIGAVSERQRLE